MLDSASQYLVRHSTGIEHASQTADLVGISQIRTKVKTRHPIRQRSSGLETDELSL
jgi:hypothetical protein